MRCFSTVSALLALPFAAVAEIYHIEAYKFKSDVSSDAIEEVVGKFLALKSQCLRDNVPLITSLSGGHQNAPEKRFNGQGYTEGFVANFKSQADLEFYDGSCVARDDFKKFVRPLIDDVVPSSGVPAYNPGCLVFDYTGVAGGDLASHTMHLVHFRFKKGIPADTQHAVMDRFLALKDECVTEGRPIVQALVAGVATSVPTVDQLYSQGFYVQFGSERDRDIYIGCAETPCQLGGTPLLSSHCEAHDNFKVFAGGFFESEQVIQPGSGEIPALHYSPGRFSFDFEVADETAEVMA